VRLLNCLKIYGDRILDGCGLSVIQLKEFLVLAEAEHAGKNIGRKHFALSIEIADHAVIKAA